MSKENQIEERIELSDIIDYALRDWDDYIYECQEEGNHPIDTFEEWIADAVLKNGYRKQSENVIELPCKVGDLVHFKGLETPWKVSAIHIYEGGQPQISITSETGKITSTMTANEFHMFCFVLTETEAKMKGGAE